MVKYMKIKENDQNVKVAYVYNGTAAPLKKSHLNIFDRIKPKSKTKLEVKK
jgi:hypothetical protein